MSVPFCFSARYFQTCREIYIAFDWLALFR